AVIRRLRGQGMAFTLDLLGEATTSEVEADAYMSRYLALIRGLSHALGEQAQVNVSLKLSALYSQFDPIDPVGSSEAVRARLLQVLRAAREARAFVHVDMEQYQFKDLTLRIVKEALEEREFAGFPDAGVVIQAYLQDSERDLTDLAAWAGRRGQPVTVRLVKGAYWDYETVVAKQRSWPAPVFQHKWETDANYEKLAEFLVRHAHWLRPSIASHNIRSIAHALAAAQQARLPREAIEFQLLHGMAEPIKRALVKMGCRVRVYLPSGHLIPGMGYLVRRILENTSNESFLRQSFLKHLPEEELLASPADAAKRVSAVADRIQPSRPALLAASPKSGDFGYMTSREGNGFINEPDSDFAKEAHRAAMAKALADVRGQFGRLYPLFIGGQEVRAERTAERRNPSRPSEVVGVVAMASKDDADRALEAASHALRAWRAAPVTKRVKHLRAAAQALRLRRFELAAWEVHEVGKSWREADADVSEAIDYLEYYAAEMLRLSAPRRLGHAPGEVNWYHYEPRGVGVVIAPWNFPLAILCGMASAAIVAGNTVVMKPAEQSSVVAAKLMDAFRDAGVPNGVVNYLL
ncbi:MAG: aldehyde dehydrogenase family protein, partial [Planctomycetes bacterium]|nr:aldehyde dehydrogenase family protein [Planctomycetota bacterium]